MVSKKLSLVLVLFAILIAACSSPATPTTVPEASTTPTEEGPYPTPLGAYVEVPTPPYPIDPPPTPDVAYVVPTPSADNGVVIGQLVNRDTGEPMAFRNVYLGFKIYMTPGPDYTLGLNPDGPLHTVTDKEGRFAIGDIPPGKYVIFVWTPFNSTTVLDPDMTRELEITIEGGETLDLGPVKAPEPM